MGRELASAFGRWFVLENFPVTPELVAVCDTNETAREWFRKVPTVQHFLTQYNQLLKHDLDVVYVAVPHNLHLEVYSAVLNSGKDLLAEKPFGIDLNAAQQIRALAKQTKRFVRCSSEFPYYSGTQRVLQYLANVKLGRIIEIYAGFLHSSDLDPTKPANWKRKEAICGEIGVMGDLGLHVLHIPLRLGWVPKRVYAQLQKGYPTRPDGSGGITNCDTWDNATLTADVQIADYEAPMRLEMKRMAPGETNTWFIEVLGAEGGVRFSTKEPKAFWEFRRNGEQKWSRIDVGFYSAFKTITGGVFEAGFPDAFQQMLASYFAERAGALGEGFGCATPDEAVQTHQIFNAALQSHQKHRAIEGRA